MSAPLVIRRAQGSPRDVERVAATLRAHGEPVGERLAAALRDDRWGVVLLAERAGALQGALVLRFCPAVGAGPDDAPTRAWVDGLFADEASVRDALRAAARAEAEGRELTLREGDEAEAEAAPTTEHDAAADEALIVPPDARLLLRAGEPAPPSVTRWSGATAFRVRLREDLPRGQWSVEGCVGADDDEGDGMRFDPGTRALRELYLHRPPRHRSDDALLARVRALTPAIGALRLPRELSRFSLPRATVAVFDVTLDVLAAFAAVPEEGALRAVAVSDALALLFLDGDYVGWRVVDPVSHLRPMGWPDVQEGAAPTQRGALVALVHDWMVIDASERPRPDEARDPDDIAHMTALRDRARSLAAQGDPDDPRPGVARDIGAHIHWSWGFFRVGEG